MEKDDTKKGRDVALIVLKMLRLSMYLVSTPKDDLALFVKQFRRILNNKGREIKKVGESSVNSKYQSRGKFTFGRKQGRFTSRRDKPSSGEYGICFSCGGNGHHAAELEKIELPRRLLICRKKTIEELNEKDSPYNDKYEKDDEIAAFEAQVQNLLESQENLMNQIHVLKANNVLYHEANRKHLLELNEANDKMLSLRKPHGVNSSLDYMENGSSSMSTKSKFVRESFCVSIQVQKLDLFPHVITVVNWATFILSLGNSTMGRMIL
ncbi:hypothetical protein D8674_035117 [Pyrus ussuriensis x Pyrus communis]|uniref:Uncharacterized protein n=1 Tax=Pyrus ussuriensis x Pyrus communis TaxID=2448454 RepID=A0A5N5GG50_9ROSA|nr:hypothetical protein D8674_035117 [Pyrus ussuriensis x Pyrus communis]